MFFQPLTSCHHRVESTSLSTRTLADYANNWDQSSVTFPEIYCANAICGWNISD
jgi:hypothetical protein